jgi:hypothetical protein
LRFARRNVERFPLEIAYSGKALAEFFVRIVTIERSVEAFDPYRYTTGIEVCGPFNISEVSFQFVPVIQKTFYHEEEIEFGKELRLRWLGDASPFGRGGIWFV